MIYRVLVGILLAVAAGVVVHAPLTVWLGVQMPELATYVKAWKEVLMGVALVLLIVRTVQLDRFGEFMRDRLVQIALAYAGLHFVMIWVFQNGLAQAGAGLLIDLRYVLYFVLVYLTLRILPQYKNLFVKVFAGGAVVVLGFALLQITVLPRDFLAHIGYSKQTIAPFLLVDENPALVRINSTLRGPNPLGAYAVIALGLLVAAIMKRQMTTRRWWLLGVMSVLAVITLVVSYSRSALLAGVITIAIAGVLSLRAKARRQVALWGLAGFVVVSLATFVARDSYFVSNVVLHNNPETGAMVDSNQGHADSLREGIDKMVRQPFGGGVGSTGSASLSGDVPLIIENQYLFVAHEVGWLGLGLFLWLTLTVINRLWQRREDALSLGVFASGIGMLTIGVLLPVWADDTVSIVWWGLAAVAIGGVYGKRKSHKKTTRTA